MNTDDCILFFYDEYQYVSCNEINEQCPVTENEPNIVIRICIN